MKKQKKKYLSYLTPFKNLKGTTHVNQELFENLSKNFEKIYIINSENLSAASRGVHRKRRDSGTPMGNLWMDIKKSINAYCWTARNRKDNANAHDRMVFMYWH